MFKNKHIDGKCNRCGEQIAKLRKQLPDKTSQRILADRMQEKGIDMDKNAIQRIEHGDRFVTDIELAAFLRRIPTATYKITPCGLHRAPEPARQRADKAHRARAQG